MLGALRILRYSISDLWEEFVVLATLNVVWSLSALVPVLPIFFVSNPIPLMATSLVLGLPLPVVSGALCHVTNQVARGQVATWSLFAEGVRRYWAKSLAVAGVNLLALAVLIGNLRFYTFVVTEAWANVALSAWIVVGLFWGLVQIYWFPMILEIKSEKVLEAMRRAIALVIISPGFSVLVGIVASLVIVVCALTAVPVLTLMASLLLLLSNHATRSRLASAQKKTYRPREIEKA
ncbi:MAG: hypothetical protein JXA93_18850 [Anaerolineae bacterium]|nr:hypothetical protein [Anaerolineae bacterium]